MISIIAAFDRNRVIGKNGRIPWKMCIRDSYGAQRIINYLNASLDRQYDISSNLHSLYDYFIRMIIKAKIKMDAGIINEIITMIDGLGDSFQEAEKIVHKK